MVVELYQNTWSQGQYFIAYDPETGKGIQWYTSPTGDNCERDHAFSVGIRDFSHDSIPKPNIGKSRLEIDSEKFSKFLKDIQEEVQNLGRGPEIRKAKLNNFFKSAVRLD